MKRPLGLSWLCAAALWSSTALGIQPDPLVSTLPDCIAVCPDGDIPTTGILRAGNNQPCAGNKVRLIFGSGCHGLGQLPPPCSQPSVLVTTSDTKGVFTFLPEVGGCCISSQPAISIEVDPGAILFAAYDEVSSVDWSFDVDGGVFKMDGTVNLADFVRFQAVFLGQPADQCHDFPTGDPPTCDDVVNLADFTAFQSHFLDGPGGCQ